jgi:glycerophosphoryl diester phosphodiesterase
VGDILTIAHKAGNDRRLLAATLEAGVEGVEADLRLDGDRLVARHERRFPFLPLFYDRWHVRWSREAQIGLGELLAHLSGRALLLADLKSKPRRSVDVLLATLKDRDAMSSALASSTYWELIGELAAREPSLRLYYSIGRREMLGAFWRRAERDRSVRGVSIHQALVDADVARRLRERGIETLAYHVNEVSRARQLVEWGITGIIGDRLEVLRAVQGER